jgi:hypothetical protein
LDATQERARLAVTRARKRVPQWQSFARMISRNPKLRLELNAVGCRTDGKTVWVKVPMSLGDDLRHDRKNCKRRDPGNKQLVCDSCRTEEDVLIGIIHEMSHVLFDSFETVNETDARNVLMAAIKSECASKPESKRAQELTRRIDRAPEHVKASYIGLANCVSPWLALIINAIEDTRVNTAMKQARPGTHVMFAAQTYRVFEQGVQQVDGTIKRWSEYPINAQAIIGLYCKTSGLDYSTWLDPEVVADLNDERLTELCDRSLGFTHVRQVYGLAFPILERLRELGYCKVPDEPEDEPDLAPPPPEQGETGDSEESEDDEEGEGASGSGDSEETGSSSGEGDDESEASPADEGDTEDDARRDSEEDSGGSSSTKPGSGQPGESLPSEQSGDGDEDGDPDDEAGAGHDAPEDSPEGEQQPGESAGSDEDDLSGGDAGGGFPGEDGGQPAQPEPQESGSDPDSEQGGDDDSGLPPDAAGTGLDDLTPPPYSDDDLDADGTPEQVSGILAVFGRHDKDGEPPSAEERNEQQEVEVAIVQIEHFDKPAEGVIGLNVNKYDEGRKNKAWTVDHYDRAHTIPVVGERVLAPALSRLRVAFTDNRRGWKVHNLKKGHISPKLLGRRVPFDDPRFFQKKKEPGKKDYFVCVGLDVSGSTSGNKVQMIKASALAMAELLDRLGVAFAVYAHSGSGHNVEIFEIKAPEQRWNDHCRKALTNLYSYSANLDGHTLEFYRKVTERRPEREKIILYYTDGHMPLENYDEELDVLQTNIEVCKRLGISLVGVGIGTDSPTQHGLDTVRVDHPDEIIHLIKELKKRLAA